MHSTTATHKVDWAAFGLAACREGDIESPWKPKCLVALRALGSDALSLTCTRLSFADPAASLKLLASSLLGDIISCSYAAAETEVPTDNPACRPVHHVERIVFGKGLEWAAAQRSYVVSVQGGA